MGILTNLVSGGAADLVKNVGGVIDNLTTSKEEKLEAERKIQGPGGSPEPPEQPQNLNINILINFAGWDN